jgi:endonuclease/exonuclease/phosphatase family metal-dependent hydrolase
VALQAGRRRSTTAGRHTRRPPAPLPLAVRTLTSSKAREYGATGSLNLPADATPHCIDFILTAGEVKVEAAALVFAEKEPLGYVSDHIGLRARLFLTPSR